MKMTTVDAVKLILETIYTDHYLKTYFGMRFCDLHIARPLDDSVKDFAEFRNSIVDEKIEKSTKDKPLKSVERTIYL